MEEHCVELLQPCLNVASRGQRVAADSKRPPVGVDHLGGAIHQTDIWIRVEHRRLTVYTARLDNEVVTVQQANVAASAALDTSVTGCSSAQVCLAYQRNAWEQVYDGANVL